MLAHWEKPWTCKADPAKRTFVIPVKIHLHGLKNMHLQVPWSEKTVWFDWNQSIFNVSFLKWKYSTFLFNSLRFKIILHLLSFLGHTEIGDMFSLFEWCAFLITPFFSNFNTSESKAYIKIICSVENLWLCVIFSCISSSAKSVYHLQDFFICCDLCLLLLPSSGFLHLLWFMFTPSTIFRISSSVVIYVDSFYHLQDFFIYCDLCLLLLPSSGFLHLSDLFPLGQTEMNLTCSEIFWLLL